MAHSIRIFSTRIKIRELFLSHKTGLICCRMEESSRGLLQQKHRAEQLKQEKTALTLSYEVSKLATVSRVRVRVRERVLIDVGV